MRKIRLIPRMDIKGDNLIKGIQLEGVRIIGKPNDYAKKYYKQGADELLYMDAVASLYGRNNLKNIVSESVKNVFIPITVGGGIRSVDDAREILRSGADKIAINTAAVKNPKLISDLVNIFGSSTVVVSIEAKYKSENSWEVYIESGREKTGLNVSEWALEVNKLGAGEILLTSVDREGTGKGYDIKLYEEASKITNVSLLAHGGAKNPSDVYEVFSKTDIDGAVIASAFHFNYYKELLDKKNIPLKGSTDFLKKNNNLPILFGINNLKEYLKKKK